MKNFTLSLLVCASILHQANAQTNKHAIQPKDISIQWQVIENNYQGKSGYISAFTITNNSKNTLPTKGWSIYFNLPRIIDTAFAYKELKFDRINGDLSRIVPTSGFQGLKPGQSVSIQMKASDWTLNSADAPSGLYLVWDDEPQNAQILPTYKIIPSTEGKQMNRNNTDIMPITTAQVVYEKNKEIIDIPAEKLTKIFPSPVEYKEKQGFFELTAALTISTDNAFAKEAQLLAAELQPILGKKPAIVNGSASIVFKKGEMGAEAYELTVDKNQVIITAATPAGAFYAIQSLKSLFPANAWASVQKSVQIQTVEVKDEPRFAWRAFMLDVGRNFQTKEQVLKVLDVLALYKINVFHFHFSEDEGWRIEIPGLPELTEVGAKRGHKDFDKNQLPPSFGSGPDNNSFGTGHYSKAEFIEILKYAHQRHIKVIPEIETPGHARAAVVSMQVRYDRLMKEGKKEEAERYLLRAPGDQSIHRSVQGWTDNVMDVSMPSTYNFLAKVVDGFIEMYKEAGIPLETIHMGGDEVPAGSWEKSPAFEKLKQENSSIKNTDDLWYYYFGKVNNILKDRGLFLYGWEEVGMRKTLLDGNKVYIPNPDFSNENIHLDVWNNLLGWGAEDLAYKLANAGYKVVLSPVSNVYFDMSYNKSFDEQGYYWGGFIDVDKPFKFIPFDYYKNSNEDRMGNALTKDFFKGKERLTDYGKSNIVGVQGLIWSETMVGPERLEYMLFPKLLGLAERAWAKDPEWANEKDEASFTTSYTKAWNEFINTVSKRELPRLSFYHGGFKYRIPTAGAIVENGTVKANVQLPGFIIKYTTNGSTPTIKSKTYTNPITEKGLIKLCVFDSYGRSGRIEEIKN
ncbi:family 20 glycosylhydrolase [Solitalea canadensis]|uniref:beta-N-acetylhexosaminidase n=1 Tax=Solitalea canadensis (strain ATCC 29591 / DSM 3403 / JCM 21819 / LMG 8368 / NBRC 15130 / NCIMB 12057 / USAM 9D) TaxID=929556 RepID=H8KM38_SOLCM|nr:family 20 glycosylhydrolase [Solitalea canadensis]AFD08960.1 N-acetyl-beta-hexosaminidase [Solitalea canadensis DSM 3403]